MNEEEIYTALLNRDEDVFHDLINQYSKLLWAVAATIITGRNQSAVMDIEEIVSDVFIRLWQHPEKYQPEKGTLKNYLAVMTKSLALNRIKQIKKYSHESLEEAGRFIEIPDEDLARLEDGGWQFLYDAIMSLEEPTKEIFIRRFFYEMKPAEIKEKMNLPSKEIDNRLYRGKKKLQEILQQHYQRNEVENS